MSDHKVPHAAGSIHDLVRKATHSPAIMTKAETIRLAEHVLKSGEHATEEEQAIARRAALDPDGVNAAEIQLLGKRAAAKK
ncbi:hypothetical protein LU298_10690 [Komagataeibacter intermedius]|uniref:Uncharacterized protein n=2 Tax=Komagataeibacter intermedius TaxID=66229 RepID=A0A0N1FBB1_9PROT|nr:hypothetical protein [Komagataeibacter intermedius]KPH86712.1 hypothetical protein GLUCOINTEAF2_0200630 [Komagataeibacter intermedius AF2]MCF3636961.1 hypothetical protein [Komagataeibacter intermedius]GAN86590.1 hypothetical protein Gain_0031_085 [Komagataeibacter intermedius TF2]GBQ76059.1 hypothetical protein AA0521_2798 [Komagataeibacter intermedius NRIC 0521]